MAGAGEAEHHNQGQYSHGEQRHAQAVDNRGRRVVLRCNAKSGAHGFTPLWGCSADGLVVEELGTLIPFSDGVVNLSLSAAATSFSVAFWLSCSARMYAATAQRS